MAEADPLIPPPPDPPPGFPPNPPSGQGERPRQNAGPPTGHGRHGPHQGRSHGARARHEAGLSTAADRQRSPAPRRGERLPPDARVPDGPAFLLLKRTDGTSFVRANPFRIRRALVALCGEVATAKTLRSGSLLVQTLSGEQNVPILGLKKFLEKDVEAVVADRLNSTSGLFYCPEVRGLSEENLLWELQDQGVTEVQRFRDVKDGPNPLIRARFRGLTLPTHIYCGYLAVQVRPWVDGPKQCRNCWEFGHFDRTCRRAAPVCGKCSGAHPTDDCEPEAHCCPSCGGPHPAWDRRCPVWKTAKAAAAEDRARQPAPPLPSQDPRVWPVLPPPGQSPERQMHWQGSPAPAVAVSHPPHQRGATVTTPPRSDPLVSAPSAPPQPARGDSPPPPSPQPQGPPPVAPEDGPGAPPCAGASPERSESDSDASDRTLMRAVSRGLPSRRSSSTPSSPAETHSSRSSRDRSPSPPPSPPPSGRRQRRSRAVARRRVLDR